MITEQKLTQDLFAGEIKYCPKSQAFSPTGKPSTVNILEEQLNAADQLLAVTPDGTLAKGAFSKLALHALKVAKSMNGLMGNARIDEVGQAMVGLCLIANHSPKYKNFEQAVSFVAHGVSSMMFGASSLGVQTSAATKMLQVFPRFRDEAIIYDSMVRNTLQAIGIPRTSTESLPAYLRAVSGLLTQPLIVTSSDNISVEEYFAQSSVIKELAARPWLCDQSSTNLPRRYVLNRALDRILWLYADALDNGFTIVN